MKPSEKLNCSMCPPNRGHNCKARVRNYPTHKDKRVQMVRIKRKIEIINL